MKSMRNRILILLAVLAIVMPMMAGEKTGSVAGVVKYTGTVPPATKVETTDGGTILHNDLVVDAKTKGLRHVFATLENATALPKVRGAKAAVMDQRDMIFVPRVVAVQHGQAVSFDNSDACNHSVLASSTVAANRFNIFVGPGKPHEHVFELQKRPVTIGCSLHGWMRAYIYVVPHPWFAVSDDKGTFKISDVPPGKYTLRLHHADTGLEERREIEVAADKAMELSVEWKKAEKQ